MVAALKMHCSTDHSVDDFLKANGSRVSKSAYTNRELSDIALQYGGNPSDTTTTTQRRREMEPNRQLYYRNDGHPLPARAWATGSCQSALL